MSVLAPLAGLANLHWLDLDHTQVSDLAPLEGCAKRRSLLWTGTAVIDLVPFARGAKLTHLSLRNTSISADQIAAVQQALPRCQIER